jgi:hypothetical protein
MNQRLGFRIAITLLTAASLAAVGFYAYNLGLAHGIAVSGHALTAPWAGSPGAFWPGPWGYHFFFPFSPLLFILLWVLVLRGLFWRGPWGHHYQWMSVPPAFEEWHRRAHAQSGTTPPSGTNV